MFVRNICEENSDSSWLCSSWFELIKNDRFLGNKNSTVLQIVNWSHGLTHWNWVTYICVYEMNIVCLDNGFAPDGRQAIMWTDGAIMSVLPLGKN